MAWNPGGIVVALVVMMPTLSMAQGVTVRAYNNYGVAGHDLAIARSHAIAILKDAGINVEWLDCWYRDKEPADAPAACRRPSGAADLTLRLHSMNAVQGQRFVSMGFSFVNVAEGLPVLATVFVDLVDTVAKGANVDFRLVLGRAIAHEIGHLLLDTSRHPAEGLMRADWSRAELRQNKAGDWLFRAEEAETMQTALRRRANLIATRD